LRRYPRLSPYLFEEDLVEVQAVVSPEQAMMDLKAILMAKKAGEKEQGKESNVS
jgi:hypothetical protein